MDCVTGKINSKSETYAESAMEANELLPYVRRPV